MNNETIDLLAYRAPLLLFQRLSSNLKFKKIAKNFKIKISKICSTIFLRIGTQMICATFREKRTQKCRSSNLKNV